MYDLILADPPWYFRNWSASAPGKTHTRTRGAAKHYPTVYTENIAKLPVADVANKDAVLLLWATWPHMPDALQLITAWGFTYKTLAWIWVKSKKNGTGFFTGMGYYSRSNSEPCLLATRGKSLKRAHADVLSVIYAPLRAHSQKPDEQYGKIDRLFGPDLHKLELFARRPQEGWDVWGNEVPRLSHLPAAFYDWSDQF